MPQKEFFTTVVFTSKMVIPPKQKYVTVRSKINSYSPIMYNINTAAKIVVFNQMSQ